MPLVSSLLDDVRPKLNDVGWQIYTNVALLPHIKSAWTTLQGRMRYAGIPVTRDSGVELTVPANTVVLTSSSSPALPADIVNIIELHEKGVGEDDSSYQLMSDVTFLPNADPGSTLQVYAWIEGRLEFIGATVDREVRIRYVRYLTTISSDATSITTIGVEEYLVHKTAALAASLIGQNRIRAGELEGEAERALQTFLGTETKGRQGDPVTRKPYGYGRRQRRWHTR